MLVFVAQVSCVYPLGAIVIMSSARRDAARTNVNKQNKTKPIETNCREETLLLKVKPKPRDMVLPKSWTMVSD